MITPTQISFPNEQFTDETSDKFVKLLSECPQLDDLNLRYSTFPETKLCTAINALAMCLWLKHLNLSCQLRMNEPAWRVLGRSLKFTPIESLDISHSNIDGNSLTLMLAPLSKHTSLQRMRLDCNPIKSAGAEAIETFLQRNTSLTDLQLFGCDIGTGGSKSIATALQNNSTLQNLNLHANDLRDEGMICISMALRINLHLKNINLEHNHCTPISGAHLLETRQQHNFSLEWINVKSNHFGKGIEKAMRQKPLKNN